MSTKVFYSVKVNSAHIESFNLIGVISSIPSDSFHMKCLSQFLLDQGAHWVNTIVFLQLLLIFHIGVESYC